MANHTTIIKRIAMKFIIHKILDVTLFEGMFRISLETFKIHSSNERSKT